MVMTAVRMDSIFQAFIEALDFPIRITRFRDLKTRIRSLLIKIGQGACPAKPLQQKRAPLQPPNHRMKKEERQLVASLLWHYECPLGYYYWKCTCDQIYKPICSSLVDSAEVQATLSEDERVERFVLALLYFTTGGASWSGIKPNF